MGGRRPKPKAKKPGEAKKPPQVLPQVTAKAEERERPAPSASVSVGPVFYVVEVCELQGEEDTVVSWPIYLSSGLEAAKKWCRGHRGYLDPFCDPERTPWFEISELRLDGPDEARFEFFEDGGSPMYNRASGPQVEPPYLVAVLDFVGKEVQERPYPRETTTPKRKSEVEEELPYPQRPDSWSGGSGEEFEGDDSW